VAIRDGLPPIIKSQRLVYYPILNLIDLAHGLDLFSNGDRKYMLQCYRTICELAYDGKCEVNAQEILFLFKTCISCALCKDIHDQTGDAKEMREEGDGPPFIDTPDELMDNGWGRSLAESTLQVLIREGSPREKTRLLEAILDTMPEMIIYHDYDLNVLWANKSAGDQVGLTREDMIGRYFYEVACRSEEPCDDCPIRRGCFTGDTEITENHLLGGRLFSTGSYPIAHAGMKFPGRLVVARDVTDRKDRYSVNEVLNLIAEVFASSRELSYIYDKLVGKIIAQFKFPTGAISLYDDSTAEIVIVGEVDYSGRIAPLEKRQPVSKTFTGLVLEDGKVVSIRALSKRPQFDDYVLKQAGAETVIVIPLNAKGKTIGALTLIDFVERLDGDLMMNALQAVANRLGAEMLRKQAEQTLREEQNFTTAVLNNAGSLILVVDKEGKVVRFNKTCERLTGYSQRELKGQYVWDKLIPSEEKIIFSRFFPFSRDKAHAIPPHFDCHWETKARERRLISWSNTVMGDESGERTHIVSIGIDITEKKKVEEEAEVRRLQLIQADKMASLGVLVAGVAHEINNPNNFIMMNAPILRKAWEDIRPILKKYAAENNDFSLARIPYTEMSVQIPALFDGIEEGSERIEHIVRSLRDYYRDDVSEMTQEVDVNMVVAAALRLLSNQIKKATKNIEVIYSKTAPLVRGNFQRMEQVIINLVQNACQALPTRDKGIEIITLYDSLSSDVLVRIRDEGIGIDEECIGKILDPFFTTKRDTGGTGLGLSVCAGIVKEHDGLLEFTSEPGEGTTVRLVLPALEANSTKGMS
jgi:PAS domain S-box-containing protein